MLLHLATLAVLICFAGACASSATNDADSNGAFKYREVYLPEGFGKEAASLGLNSLETDWGIWGHNLAKVLPDNHSQSVYAKINGNSNKKQFCFSSNHLYEYIEDYIDSKFDEDESIRFAIIPNDNDIVCLCEKCVTAGNAHHDASPAVNKLVRKLAARFPYHKFYTSDYRTTQSLPTDSMPANSGVLISAMSYPLSSSSTPEEMRFIKRINDWSSTTPRIVIWDYINNFDDYFTPYPIFNIMQRRLKNYRDNKVTAVFLNGSGTNLSAMSDLKTEVLAEMTFDPDIDWKETLTRKALEKYPETGQIIADFMIFQEDLVSRSGVTLPMYEGVKTALNTYLPENEFIAFHDNLLRKRPLVKGDERKMLDSLLGQLAFTRLEINRINGTLKSSDPLLNDLMSLTKVDNPGYNESGWSIESYVNDYHFLLDDYNKSGKNHKLKGEKIVPLTPLDPEYTDVAVLTDGILGIPSNYHSGQLISSPHNSTQLAIPNKGGLKKIRVWFTYNPVYRISLPESVLLTAGEKRIGQKFPEYPENLSGHAFVDFDIPANTEGSFTLTVTKNPESHSMAIEEIEGF